MNKRFLIICRRPPYGNSLAREGLEFALAASTFGQSLSVLFMGDGVWQLKSDQDSHAIHDKNHSKLLSAFPLYDIDSLYIEQAAIEQRRLEPEQLILPATVLGNEALRDFMTQFDVVVNF